MASRSETLQTFVNFCKEHIRGDEKGEAQTFLNEFFRAFDYDGALQAGAEFEQRIRKGSKKGKTGFADLVWKPRVLIEMKKRGTDLSKHYSQAFDYWQRAVPNRPRYVLLCNFDEFWIYDFDTQIDTPVDTVSLEQLPQQAGAFAFMEKGDRTPVFRNNQVEVTEAAAERMGELLIVLKDRGIELLAAQHLVLQCVLAMFAEDRALLPRDLFVSCIQECLNGKSSYDVLSALFREMDQPGITPAGQFKGVDYFNGGLFSTVYPLELTREELKMLEDSALEDWSKVRPAIFGSIFESAIDQKERHKHGIHYTSEADIMKIVRPTISRYWEERIEEAGTISQLESLQLELQNYRVLDPACGSGNFLYIAYQELKQVEQLLLDKIASRRRSPREQIQMGFVTPLQFYGIDNNPFAVELARVTMMIARKVAIDRLGLYEPALPLDTLDQNVVCDDALFVAWPKVNAVIGNPPFLGGSRIRTHLGDEYAESLFQKFSEVKDQVDFCSYWFRLSHDHVNEEGRVGLVATNSIRDIKSRAASLEYITSHGGHIYEATSSQKWSGEANVHVSIVNWMKKEALALYLDDVQVDTINSSLQASIDLSEAKQIKANSGLCWEGAKPTGKGFILDEKKVNQWIESDPTNGDVLKLFSMGSNLAKNPHGLPNRWIIDFDDRSIEEASCYSLPFEHVRSYVKPQRDKNRRKSRRLRWWRYGENATKMRAATSSLSSYFVVPRVSKWAIFMPIESGWLLGEKTVVVASDDFYILGILLSDVHRSWMHSQKSTLKSDIAYTPRTCFETFPFPQAPSIEMVEAIRCKALELHHYRSNQMEQRQWGITKIYNAFFDEPASQLYRLHRELDTLVLNAYGFDSDNNILNCLLSLNLDLIEIEKSKGNVVGPWSPFDR